MRHIANVTDGHIVVFEGCDYAFIKVCNRQGIGGVVRADSGLYLTYEELKEEYGVDITSAIDILIAPKIIKSDA